MASQHEHKHTSACNHGHHHNDNHSHSPVHNHQNGHKHGANCQHDHEHSTSNKSNNDKSSDSGFRELTAKEWEKRKARRKLKQYSRRVNHTIQNVVAAVWIWMVPESSLNYYYETGEYHKILMFHVLQIVSLMLFFWSSLSEPGFLEENNIQAFSSKTNKKNDDNQEQVSLLSSNDIDLENGQSMLTINISKDTPPSFCRSCKFLRPIRAKHCYFCDRCVPRFDHHCPLIEQCVGAKNYRPFYILCNSQWFVSGWSWLIAVECLFYSESANRSYIGWIFRILLFLWMCYQIFMATSLISFHTYLICTNQTTFEFLKPKKLKKILKYETSKKDKNNNYMPIDIDLNELDKTKNIKKQKGLPPPHKLLVKMCNGLGFCLCDYPFSNGFITNWYGFLTATSLLRPEYFITKPVLITKDPPKKEETNNNDDGNNDKTNTPDTKDK